MISSILNSILAATIEERLKAVEDGLALDSKILAEQFYFFTVVVMWLIHAGFMAYEAGCRAPQERDVDGDEEHPDDRRRHADLLLLRLVHLRLLRGGLAEGRPREPRRVPRLLRADRAVERGSRPNLADHASLVFFLAFLLFSWTTASIMSGA